LPLTDEKIHALVDKKVRETVALIQEDIRDAEVLALKEQLTTMIADVDEENARIDKLLEKLDGDIALSKSLGKRIEALEHRLAILTRNPPQNFAEAMGRASRSKPDRVKYRDADTREYG
jgi:hypothetical protein